MDDRFWFCVFSAVLLFLVAVLGAWLPRHLSQKSASAVSAATKLDNSTMYHLGNCLSGGVMLSAGFCHLLADSLPMLGFVGPFPMANFLAALGLLLTLFADQVVHMVTDSASHDEVDSLDHDRDSVDTELAQGKCFGRGGEGGKQNGIGNGQAALGGSQRAPFTESSPLLAASAAHDHSHGACGHLPGIAHPVRQNSWGSTSKIAKPGAPAVHDCSSGPHIDVLFGGGGKQLSFATTVLLAGALCVHSVLEGMALGAQQELRDTEKIMIAIAAHKGLAAYALGASVVESNASSRRFWSVIMAFSLASPIGIFVGYALSTVSGSKGGASLSALASGTFLYVAMMEVIPRELSVSSLRMRKMLAISIGFGLMSLLAIWA